VKVANKTMRIKKTKLAEWLLKQGLIKEAKEAEPPQIRPASAFFCTGKNEFGYQSFERVVSVERGNDGEKKYSFFTRVYIDERSQGRLSLIRQDLSHDQHEYLVKELSKKLNGILIPAVIVEK
jgi:hypothetical protein